MLPIIIHTSSFYNFTTSIIREPIPFSEKRRFWDFSVLVEAFVLSDEIFFWNTGAYNFEWTGGYYTIPGNSPSIHPYEVFHGFDFINEAPFGYIRNDDRIIEFIDRDARDEIIRQELGEEPTHKYTISSTLGMYEQAYNGDFGDISVLEPPFIKDILPKIIRFKDGKEPIANDPLIFQGYDALKNKYEEKISPLKENGIFSFVVPPITAILLSRLPDNCTDPNIVIRQLVELREELEPVRHRYNELEEVFYSDEASLKDLFGVKEAINADSNQIEKRLGIGFYDNAAVRWFADNLTLIVKTLTMQGIDVEEALNVLGDTAPDIRKSISTKRPTRLYSLTMDTQNIKNISSLLKNKLNIDL